MATNDKLKLPIKPGLKLGEKGKDVESLQRLLIDYGYLTTEHPAEESGTISAWLLEKLGVFDTSTKRALMVFQEEMGLKPSGFVDQPTLKVIQSINCRVVVAQAGLLSEIVDYFPKRIYTYKIINGTEEFDMATLRQAIAQSFSLWSAKTPLAFIPTSGDNYDISLAFTSFPDGYAAIANAWIHFNEEISWRIGPITGQIPTDSYDIITTATHEIGHKMGLGHNIPPIPGSVMNASQGVGWKRKLHTIDIANIQALYGHPEIWPPIMVHGNNAQVENGENLNAFIPQGPHATALGKKNTDVWFHFSIPTPSFNPWGDARLRLNAVLLKITTFLTTEVTQVDIWDGATLLGRHFLNFSVSNLPAKTWDLHLGVAHKPLVNTSVGVSVKVRFNTGNDRVHLNAAGAEYVRDRLVPPGPVSDI